MKKKLTLIGALIIAGVILLNALISVLSYEKMWYTDLTQEKYRNAVYELNEDGSRKRDTKGNYIYHYENTGLTMYTLSSDCFDLINGSMPAKVDEVNAARAAEGLEPLKIHIVFCTEPDKLDSNTTTRYIHYTAIELKNAFPDYIDIKYINMVKNPSAVQKYKANSASNIYSSNVIIEFGTEYRVYSVKAMFTFNEDEEDTPWAYNGEKKFAAGILAVTRAESPICCLLTNHGEHVSLDGEFAKLIRSAGYELQTLDLYNEEIPENCRLIICVNPQTDFIAYGSQGYNGVSEITKLDKYLDKAYSFVYFFDATTPDLFNLENYLATWGITKGERKNDAGETDSYTIRNTEQSLDSAGYTLIADYATAGGGASITEDMRSTGVPSKVIFGNSCSVTPSPSYQKTYTASEISTDDSSETQDCIYYTYAKNGIYRYMFDVFTSGTAAVAEVDGQTVDAATEIEQFKLMTITRESRSIQENNYTTINDASYVCAVASTEFISDAVLSSPAYGNADVLLGTFRMLGKEIVPVGLGFKAFYITDMEDDTLEDAKARTITIWLSVTPLVLMLCAGIIVTVRRKYL